MRLLAERQAHSQRDESVPGAGSPKGSECTKRIEESRSAWRARTSFAVAPAYRRQAVQTAGLGERRQSLGKEKRTFHPRRRGYFVSTKGLPAFFPRTVFALEDGWRPRGRGTRRAALRKLALALVELLRYEARSATSK